MELSSGLLLVCGLLLLGNHVDRSECAPAVEDEQMEGKLRGDGAPELLNEISGGCYYMFNHYGEGDRILTNEPCLNCTCHNAMLMCYLRVCPFTKPIGQDCTIEKKPDQCCPVITCPQVPVSLITPSQMAPTTSTTTVSAVSATDLAISDRGCQMDGKYYPDGAQVISDPNKPCELCYCIRNRTACVMQECILHVEGCTPIFEPSVCCPVRYQCDGPMEIEGPTSTLTSLVGTTISSLIAGITSHPSGCYRNGEYYSDGSPIYTPDETPCEHCYCMRGEIVCAVQECGTPLENEEGNCTAIPPRAGLCCPEKYACTREGWDCGVEGKCRHSSSSRSFSNGSRGDREFSLEGVNVTSDVEMTLSPVEATTTNGESDDMGGEERDKNPASVENLDTTTTVKYSEKEEAMRPHAIEEEHVSEEHVPTTSKLVSDNFEEPDNRVDSTTVNKGLEAEEVKTEEPENVEPETGSTPVAQPDGDHNLDPTTQKTIPQEINEETTTGLAPEKHHESHDETTQRLVVEEHTIVPTSPEPQQSSEQSEDELQVPVDVKTHDDVHGGEPTVPVPTTIKTTVEIGSTEYEQGEVEKESFEESSTKFVSPHENAVPDPTTTTYVGLYESDHSDPIEPEEDKKEPAVTTLAPTVPIKDIDKIDQDVPTETAKVAEVENPTTVSIEYDPEKYLGNGHVANSQIKDEVIETTVRPLPNPQVDPDLVEATNHVLTEPPTKVFEKTPEIEATTTPQKVAPEAETTVIYDQSPVGDGMKDDEIKTTSGSREEEPPVTTYRPPFAFPLNIEKEEGTTAKAEDPEIPTTVKQSLEVQESDKNEVDVSLPTSSEASESESTSESEKVDGTSVEPPSSSESHSDELPPTTTAGVKENSDEVEIITKAPVFAPPPRVPGEGSCFVEGKTYRNGTRIPPSTPCQLACACQNSIVHCLLVHCPPPPSDSIGECKQVYTPGICCPQYDCDSGEKEQASVTVTPNSVSDIDPTKETITVLPIQSQAPEEEKEGKETTTVYSEVPKEVFHVPSPSTEPEISSGVSIEPEVPVAIPFEHEVPAANPSEPEVPTTSSPIEPEVPAAGHSIEPEIPAANPSVEPEIATTSPSVEQEVSPASPSIEPQVPVASHAVQPDVPAPSPSIEPEVPTTSHSIEPEVPAASPSIEPEVPVASPSVEPEVPAASPSFEPEVPTSHPVRPEIVAPPAVPLEETTVYVEKVEEGHDSSNHVESPAHDEKLPAAIENEISPPEIVPPPIVSSSPPIVVESPKEPVDGGEDSSVELQRPHAPSKEDDNLAITEEIVESIRNLTKPTFSPLKQVTVTNSPVPAWPYLTSTMAPTMSSGACLFDGKVYMSAQQIPREDPCDFCFCFRGDIICLQQSCPPPIPGCYEEPIPGFCCPRYECPVGSGNSTAQPPLFPPSYYHNQILNSVAGGSGPSGVVPSNIASGPGCEIQGEYYETGQVITSTSGPCLECRCGAKGMMECDPRECQPEPMLRKMIAAITSR